MAHECYDGITSTMLPPLLPLAEVRASIRTSHHNQILGSRALCLLVVKFRTGVVTRKNKEHGTSVLRNADMI